MDTITFPHVPVLLQETLKGLNLKPDGCYVDGTLGAGGHSEAILCATAPDGIVISMDIDTVAIAVAMDRLEKYGSRSQIIHDSYASFAQRLPVDQLIDGFLLDLGVSSMQIDHAERGFSFLKDGALDMRFSENQTRTAAEIVNTTPLKELIAILREYGEERQSTRIATAIVHARMQAPITSTLQLARIIQTTVGNHEKIHPATRTFQALRIAVNDELRILADTLPGVLERLKIGGRIVIISFHSLEDRIVKNFFNLESRACHCPPRQVICTCEHQAQLKIITKKVIIADDTEIARNTRARSAKLRIAERIGAAER